MKKIQGTLSDFAYFKEEGGRYVIGYGLKELGNSLYEWYEVYIYKRQQSIISFLDVKAAVEGDINADTSARITQGFAYTVKHGAQEGTDVNVWLSKENQSDFHAMHQNADALTFPVRYKIGETADGMPVYEEFADADEMHTICTMTSQHVLACQQEGWARKDAIDWEPYKALFPEPEQPNATE
jgi:hypothetical protein